MWLDFGIGEKKKPVVQIYDDHIRDSGDVDVQDFRLAEFQPRPGGVVKAAEPKPDTIESLINRLIELGEPKPEVVITGEKRAGGGEWYEATVNDKRVGLHFGWATVMGFSELSDAEEAVMGDLKRRLRRVVTETTVITY